MRLYTFFLSIIFYHELIMFAVPISSINSFYILGSKFPPIQRFYLSEMKIILIGSVPFNHDTCHNYHVNVNANSSRRASTSFANSFNEWDNSKCLPDLFVYGIISIFLLANNTFFIFSDISPSAVTK